MKYICVIEVTNSTGYKYLKKQQLMTKIVNTYSSPAIIELLAKADILVFSGPICTIKIVTYCETNLEKKKSYLPEVDYSSNKV